VRNKPTKPPKSRAAVELGRKRWTGLSAEERSKIARRAVQARWAKRKPPLKKPPLRAR
jgi:hypothetical protein